MCFQMCFVYMFFHFSLAVCQLQRYYIILWFEFQFTVYVEVFKSVHFDMNL